MLQRLLDFYNGPYLMPIILLFGPVFFLLVFGYQPSPTPLPSANEDHEEKKDTPARREVSSDKGSEGGSKEKANAGFNPSSLFGAPGGTNKIELPPPRHDILSRRELAFHDGTNERIGLLVAVKGDVFDVSDNRSTYGPGGGYHMFAGKDASRALAISSLKLADCHDDLTGLTEQQLRVLDDWHKFFQERYAIIGKLEKR